MHLKRHKAPKNWPIERKGTAYVVRPNANLSQGIPLLIALRDILKVAQNRKEVKKAIHLKQILINGSPARDEKNSLTLFDILTFVTSDESYKVSLSEKGKFTIEKISKEEGKKVAKIINKKILKGKKIQLNLSDGRNLLSDIQCNVNDSVVVNFKNKKVEKCLPLEDKAHILIFAGKHSGTRGIINKVDNESKMAEIDSKDKKINVLIKQLMVTENE